MESSMCKLTCCTGKDGSVMPHLMTMAVDIFVVRLNGIPALHILHQSIIGHQYNIYPEPSEPCIDAHHHLLQWQEWYTCYLTKGVILPTSFIFPHISLATSLVSPVTAMSAENVQKLLNLFTDGAGLNHGGRYLYTTHAFRRGGAQYYFMFCKPGERWSLSRVRWWGGWADDEKNDVLIRYLLDEMVSIEEDHSDALAPIQGGFDVSRGGEASLVAPLTTEEFRCHSQQHVLALSSMEERLTQIETQIHDSFQVLGHPINGQSAGERFTSCCAHKFTITRLPTIHRCCCGYDHLSSAPSPSYSSIFSCTSTTT